MTSKEVYGHLPQRMNFERANGYLKDLKKVFGIVELPFFLFCGTLVGAIRDQDFPWQDDDVDVGILFEDAQKLLDAKAYFVELGYYFATGARQGNKYSNCYIAKKEFREKVDIYTLSMFKGDRCYFYSSQGDDDVYMTFPKKHFESFEEIEFKGEKYKVPNDPKGLLTYMWHDWETPQGGNWGKMGNKRIPKGTFNPEGS